MLLRTILWLSILSVTILNAQNPTISTAQYDNYRRNANLNEKTLTVSNTNVNSFGKLGSYPVDGAVFAQPLYIPQVQFSTGRTLNVLFVATMNNTVYAFDADQPGSSPVWQQHLSPAVPVNYAGTCPGGGTGQLGILSTPVIDTLSKTIYVVYATPSGPGAYSHYMAALSILDGIHKSGSPNLIKASVLGSGYDASNGTVSLNQSTYIQRTALTLANGSVYAGFSSCGPDPDPYHGWVIGYSALNVGLQSAVYNVTPNGSRGAIWQSGRGLVVDDLGSLYALTGNGTNSLTDMSDSVVKISANGLLLDWFRPPNFGPLNDYDLDLSSSGPLYTGSTHLLLAGGKEGVVYVMNPLLLGENGGLLQILQPVTLQAATSCGTYEFSGCYQIHSLAYWDSASNPLLYVWGLHDNLRAYRYSNGQFNPVPDSQNSLLVGYPGATMALSAQGDTPNSGILWALTPDGALRAFQATNVANELYDSNQNSARDSVGSPTKFAEPTIANGRVYVPTTDGQLKVYGLLPGQ